MTRHLIRAFAIMLLGALILSCERDASTNPDIPPNPFKLLPDSGAIGSLIKIQGSGFFPSGNNMRFTGTFNFGSYAPVGDTISVEVPFGATTGPITIITNSGEQQTLTFKVTEQYDPAALTVRPWNLPPQPFGPDSCPNMDFSGIFRCWERRIVGDTLILTLGDYVLSSYDVRTQVFKFLDNGPGRLPLVISIVVYTTYGSTTRIDSLKRGLIKIRRWDFPGRVEGKIFPEPRAVPPQAIPPNLVTSFMSG